MRHVSGSFIRYLRRALRLAGILSVAALFGSTVHDAHAAPECELGHPLIFADLDWDSARLHTAIASYIVEHGYGCSTERVTSGTIDGLEQMMVGGIDVMMGGLDGQCHRDVDRCRGKNGLIVDFGVNFDEAVQGWFVPRYLIEGDPAREIEPRAQGLRSVTDLSRYKHLFSESGDASRGVFMNCPATWGCAGVNTKKLRIYGLADHFADRRAENGDTLAAHIAGRYISGEPFLAHYWSPTWILGAYDLVRLEEPPYDPEVWRELEGQENASRATAYPSSTVHVGGSFVLELEAPRLASFFGRYRTENDLLNEILAVRHVRRLTTEELALVFMKRYESVWTKWLPEDVADALRTRLEATDEP